MPRRHRTNKCNQYVYLLYTQRTVFKCSSLSLWLSYNVCDNDILAMLYKILDCTYAEPNRDTTIVRLLVQSMSPQKCVQNNHLIRQTSHCHKQLGIMFENGIRDSPGTASALHRALLYQNTESLSLLLTMCNYSTYAIHHVFTGLYIHRPGARQGALRSFRKRRFSFKEIK